MIESFIEFTTFLMLAFMLVIGTVALVRIAIALEELSEEMRKIKSVTVDIDEGQQQ